MQLRFSRSLLVTLAVVLAACGEDNPKPDDTGEPTDTGDTAPPDVPPEPLAGSYVVDQADAIIRDPEGVTQLGIGMGVAGDMDGDGREDLLVVSPSCSEEIAIEPGDPGCVHLFLGPVDGDRTPEDAHATLEGTFDNAWAGCELAPGADVDDDGFDDVLIGSLGNHYGEAEPQAAWLVHGPVSGAMSLADADLVLLAGANGDSAGPVSLGGDIDGDGARDLMVGAPQDDRAAPEGGAVYLMDASGVGVVSLADASVAIYSDALIGHAGFAVSFVGDSDGDGVDDILVGVPQEEWGGTSEHVPGAAYLFHGPIAGSLALHDAEAVVRVTDMDAAVGRCVRGLGDTDGDGLDDMAIGAVIYSGSGGGTGAVGIFRGPMVSDYDLSEANLLIEGATGDAYIGDVIGAPGDVDGDGRGDVVLGAMFVDDPAKHAGHVWLHTDLQSGVTSTAEATASFSATESHQYLGFAVSGAGDQNADGYADIIMGTFDRQVQGVLTGAYLFYGG
jgi:hypothetical protein